MPASNRDIAVFDDHPVRRQRAESHRALHRLVGSAPLRTLSGDTAGTIPFDVVADKVVLKASANGQIPTDFAHPRLARSP